VAPPTVNVPWERAGWCRLFLEVLEASVGTGVQAGRYEGEGSGLVWSRAGGLKGASCKAEGR